MLEGHSLFISVRNTILNLDSLKGQCQILNLLFTSLLLAAVSIVSKHKWRMRKKNVGNHFEFFDFILLKETFQEEMRSDLIPKM